MKEQRFEKVVEDAVWNGSTLQIVVLFLLGYFGAIFFDGWYRTGFAILSILFIWLLSLDGRKVYWRKIK